VRDAKRAAREAKEGPGGREPCGTRTSGPPWTAGCWRTQMIVQDRSYGPWHRPAA
jgi:hypothetical protein